MQPLELNLSTRPFRNNTLPRLSYGLVFLLLVLLSVSNFQTYQTKKDLFNDLQTVVAEIQTESRELNDRATDARADISTFDISSLDVQASRANEFIRWKAFSWTRLFNQLQAVQPHNVQMSSVRPSFRKKRSARNQKPATDESESIPVNVEGLAKTMKDFFDLERALIADPHFDRIEPQATATDDTTNEIVFSLRFLYSPSVEPPPEVQATDEFDPGTPGPGADEQVPTEPQPSSAVERAGGLPAASNGRDG